MSKVIELYRILNGTTGMPAEFSQAGKTKEDVSKLFNAEMERLAPKGDYKTFKKNKAEIFAIIEEVLGEELPKEVMESMGSWAQVDVFKNGDRPRYLIAKNKNGIRKSVTEIALSGRPKRTKMDRGYKEVEMKAFGTATSFSREELRDGLFNIQEWKDEVIQGIKDAMYAKVQEVLAATVDSLPSNNKKNGAGFIPKTVDGLISKAKSYGDRVEILCTERFAQEIPFDPNDQIAIGERRTHGYTRVYKGGVTVNIMPNSLKTPYGDEFVFDDKRAYILPVGKEKFIKIPVEGDVEIDEYTEQDTKEEVFEAYSRFNALVVIDPCMLFVYDNTELAK